jgi:ATP-binding cassette subfamily F protein 2
MSHSFPHSFHSLYHLLPSFPTFSIIDDTTLEIRGLNDGDAELFEKKLSKDEKKARAKAAREAKRLQKNGGTATANDNNDEGTSRSAAQVLEQAKQTLQQSTATTSRNNNNNSDDGLDHEQTDALASAGTICTYASNRKLDPRSRDIHVDNVTLQHMGAVLLQETQITLSHGNRYGLIGRNGCGKVSI